MDLEEEKNVDICGLCLCSKYRKIGHNNKSVNLIFKIKKYLKINVHPVVVKSICLNCYHAIEDFHVFFQKIQDARIKALGHDYGGFQTSVCTQTDEKLEFDELEQSPVTDNNDSVKECLGTQNSELETELSIKNDQLDDESKMVAFYNIQCDKCVGNMTEFKTFKSLHNHYLKVHNCKGYVTCCKRNIRLLDKSYLRSHMLKHLEPNSCKCNVCGKELSSVVTLKRHLLLHGPESERPFHCNFCEKKFCSKTDLKNHINCLHVPEDKKEDYICYVCGKVFQKIATLRYHHLSVHVNEKKMICELCAKCFTSRSGLRSHLKAAHNTLGPIKCSVCSKWLKNDETLKRHNKLHENNLYPCTMCNKTCRSSNSLRGHLIKHSQERPHQCQGCTKSFKTKTHLKNHFTTQHIGGNNRFPCQFCGKLFVNMSNYYTHRRRMHSERVDQIRK